tara:strand:- start:624 stop:920 length:297 start_codon:yes stop_codon:yes gene_type:complete
MRLLVCPHCQTQLNCPAEAGVEMVCSTCGGKFTTPEEVASVGFDFSPQSQPQLGNQDLIRELKRQTELLDKASGQLKGILWWTIFGVISWLYLVFKDF